MSEASGSKTEPGRRRADISRILLDVADRRALGEALPDETIIAAHPQLMPELQEELQALHMAHRAFLAAQKAGPKPPATPPGNPTAQPSVGIQGYDILEPISEGGQGTVYRARHQSTGRNVAIKVIPGGPFMASQNRARFEREIGILARLDHPNIVGVLDSGRTSDGSPFMVMNFVDGCTFEEYIDHWRQQEQVSLNDLLGIFVKVAHALDEAHRYGIIHRDLKPSNIRIDRRGDPHILDFGLARFSGLATGSGAAHRSVTMTGQIVGSLPWASPEHLRGDASVVDARADIYSLGVMLYQAATGQFPYKVIGAVPDVIEQILKVEPRPPSQVRLTGPIVSHGLDGIILRALAKRPGDRFASARALAEALERHIAGFSVIAYVPPHQRPWRGWRPWLAFAAAGALVLAAGMGFRWYQERTAPAVTVTVARVPSLTNSIGLRLVRIPAGRFQMGSSSSAPNHYADERYRHINLLHAYYISTTEVTQGQWSAVMGELPPGIADVDPNLPVHNVTWAEAVRFCQKLSETENRVYRLPTEAEWEKACRAGTSSEFAGNRILDRMGWYVANSGGRFRAVAKKTSNHWGLFDMHGNVREWCADEYSEVKSPAAAAPLTNPPQTQPSAAIRVVRGGSALLPAMECRSARRNKLPQTQRAVDVGFRIVLDEPIQR